MGLFDKKSSNTTNVKESNTYSDDNRVGGDGSVFGSNITIGNDVNGVEIMTTDYGAVKSAFDAFDKVVQANDDGAKRTLAAISKNTDNTVATLKDFAQTLKVGDIEGAKYIAYAIIAAVMIILVVYIWKS